MMEAETEMTLAYTISTSHCKLSSLGFSGMDSSH